MVTRIFKVGEKDLVALKVLRDHEQLSNEQYAEKLFARLGIVAELVNSLHEQEVKLPRWKIWSESLAFKFCFHTASFLRLFSGTEIPFQVAGKNIVVFDEPTAIVLFRTILENYITFFYLYVDNVSDEEKEFRFMVYEYCGMKQRTGFEVRTKETKAKQAAEIAVVQDLKGKIEASPYFSKMEKRAKKSVMDGVKPRLFGWPELLLKCGFREDLFKNIYGYKSNYTHSEFISLMQINSGNYGHVPNGRKQHYTLFLLHMILSKFIKDLTQVFYPIKLLYYTKEKDLITEIEFLSNMVTGKVIDKDLR